MSDPATLIQQIAQYDFYHCIEVAPGVFTRGNEDYLRLQEPIMATLKRHNLRGKRVLDIGCRDGLFAFQAERMGAAEVIGIDNDLSVAATEFLIPHFKSSVHMHQMNLYDLQVIPENRFDFVIFAGVLYHLREPFLGVRRIANAMKPGGELLLETAMIVNYPDHAMLYCPDPKDSPYERTSVTFFNHKGLCAALNSCGFTNVRCQALFFGDTVFNSHEDFLESPIGHLSAEPNIVIARGTYTATSTDVRNGDLERYWYGTHALNSNHDEGRRFLHEAKVPDDVHDLVNDENEPDITYHFDNNVSIRLPNNHLLPTFQSEHRLYDRLLPVAARFLPPESTVVDVGANCGDTLAAMFAANKLLNFVCIEPDDIFYEYLSENIGLIRQHHPSASIKSIKALIANCIDQATLIAGDNASTRRMVQTEVQVGKRVKTQKLDDIIGKTESPVSLIKSDVDGYDYDVLQSAESTIIRYEPLLYFEYQAVSVEQSQGYGRLVSWLWGIGYRDYVIFDNYGGVMMRSSDPETLPQLSRYIQGQNSKILTRTIYYLDVLCASSLNAESVSSILRAYSAAHLHER